MNASGITATEGMMELAEGRERLERLRERVATLGRFL